MGTGEKISLKEIRVKFESADEKARVEIESKKLGLTQTALLRLLFLNFIGEVRFERKVSNEGGDNGSRQ